MTAFGSLRTRLLVIAIMLMSSVGSGIAGSQPAPAVNKITTVQSGEPAPAPLVPCPCVLSANCAPVGVFVPATDKAASLNPSRDVRLRPCSDPALLGLNPTTDPPPPKIA